MLLLRRLYYDSFYDYDYCCYYYYYCCCYGYGGCPWIGCTRSLVVP